MGVGFLREFYANIGAYAAPRGKLRCNFHPFRPCGGDKIIKNLICQGFIENALVSEPLHIVFEALKLDAELVRDVFYYYSSEVGLACFGANAGKFGAFDGYSVIPAHAGVIKKFKFGFFTHLYFLSRL